MPSETGDPLFESTFEDQLLLFLKLSRSVLLNLVLLSSPVLAQNVEADLKRYPLQPPDTSSPRDTLRSFRENFHEAVIRWRDGAPRAAVSRVQRRALRCLNLREVEAAWWDASTIENGFYLLELLYRVELPPEQEIPDDDKVQAQNITQWTIPHTEITIEKVADGPRQGEFLFSARTVARLDRYYALSRNLPYKPEATPIIGAFNEWRVSPGPLIPRTWVLELPRWTLDPFFGYAIWKWLAVILALLLGIVILRLLYTIGRNWDESREQNHPWTRTGKPLAAIMSIGLVFSIEYLIIEGVNLSGQFLVFVAGILSISYFTAIAWLLALLVKLVGETIIFTQRPKSAVAFNPPLVRLLYRLIAVLIVVYVGLYAAETLGIPVAPLLAGLGVGGLAIALAVRPTLENIVGGFMLFADKPVQVGEFCEFGDKSGTVEEIGLRSTRLRAVDRTVITVPNSEFSQLQLINITRRDRIMFKCRIGLRCETNSEQLRYVIAKLREMLIRHERVMPQPLRVRFIEIGISSLDVEILAYISSTNYNEYLGIREDLNLRIMDIVAEAGTDFAFPSQTIYMSRDSGIDTERVHNAEKQVSDWRSKSRLPFPDFSMEEREKLLDTISFPAEGSPDYTPRGITGSTAAKRSEDPQNK